MSGEAPHPAPVDPQHATAFRVPQAGRYRIRVQAAVGPEGGTARLALDGEPCGTYRFYSHTPNQGPLLTLGAFELEAGEHVLNDAEIAPGNGMGTGGGDAVWPCRVEAVAEQDLIPHKTCSTLYTPERLAAARRNAHETPWGRQLRDAAVARAEPLAALGYDRLWRLVPAETVARCITTNGPARNLSPLTGEAIKRYGFYPWRLEPLRQPWKLIDPTTNAAFPTNDFAAYHQSGLDERGRFDPSRADRRFLLNESLPERGPDWGVDDGRGWLDPASGERYMFVATYAHWGAWCGSDAVLDAGLRALRDAYLYTGDLRYGRAGAILLDRIADVYPALDLGLFDPELHYNSHGGTALGKAVGCIWECQLAKEFLSCYDAFFPVFDDPEVLAFVAEMGRHYRLPFKRSGDQLRRGIEDHLVRQIDPAIRTARLRGNNGMHQSALALAVRVLEGAPETKGWTEFNLRPGGFVRRSGGPPAVTGGNILGTLIDDVDRDGHGNEAAPGYNSIWPNNYLDVAELFRGTGTPLDLFANVKFRKMLAAQIPLLLPGRSFPLIGDFGDTGKPATSLNLAHLVKAYEVYGDPLFAQAAHHLGGGSDAEPAAAAGRDLLAQDPEGSARAIADAVERHGPLALPSTNQTGYGLAVLRDGGARGDSVASPKPSGEQMPAAVHERAAWLYYGRNTGHGHRDTLNLGLHAYGLDLAPDLGYPEAANATDAHRHEWMINTISHNTVVVDRAKQSPHWGGHPHHFDDGERVKLIDVSAPDVYPQTGLYRRVTALIRIDAARFYLVDLFAVHGGREHHFSFHGAEGPVTADGLRLVAQPNGSYVGADVPFGVRPESDSVGGGGYTGGGFHWLGNVSRDAQPPDCLSVDWQVKDTWHIHPEPRDVHLRLTMLGAFDDVALADGVPPRNRPGVPQRIRYLLALRRGETLRSLFTSVIEPYEAAPAIVRVTALPVTYGSASEDAGAKAYAVHDGAARALRVELSDGRIDTIICSLNPDQPLDVDGELAFKGFFGLYSERNGVREHAYLCDGERISKAGDLLTGPARLSGAVLDFTRTPAVANHITIRLPLGGLPPEALVGRWIDVENDGVRNAVYRIEGVVPEGGDRLTLAIGDTTLIRGHIDRTDPA
ncbi:MAG TPA: heparinase II/III family protein, partial [Limnochordia bacterium]|nr:heparinase II/III family protein [Limnochordia bacterium]